MQHVDEGLLHARLDGQLAALGPGREAEVERHLAGCAECRARLEEARAVRDRADALLRGDPVAVEVPPFEALVARPAPRARRRRRGPPLAWAASIVLAVGAGWLARSALQGPAPREEAPARAVAAAPAPVTTAAAPAPVTSAPAGAPRVASASQPTAPAEPPRDLAGERPRPLRVAAREAAKPEPPSAPGETAGLPEPAAAPPAAVPAAPPPPVGLAAREAGPDQVARREREAPRGMALTEGARQRRTPADSGPIALEGLVVAGNTGSPSYRLSTADPGGWFGIGTREARRLLGRDPLRVRGLPVVAVQAGVLDGREVVRVRQALGQGALLSLVQARALRAGAAPADSTLPGARDHTPGEQARLVRLVGDVTVTASAPLPADSLARLLERLR